MERKVLEIEDIHVYRGRTYVLQGISLQVDDAEIVAMIGANGAGKTTLLRTISGLLRPQTGRINYRPEPDVEFLEISSKSSEDIVKLGISHCPEGRGIFAQLTVWENLLIGAYLRSDKKSIGDDLQRVCDIFPVLGERPKQIAGSLSGGEQEMLAVGRALMSRPRLLILDEPSLGLAPIVIENLFEVLSEINRQGVTILIVEQNAVMALELAHRAYVLETGRITLSGKSAALADDEKVRNAYLGGSP